MLRAIFALLIFYFGLGNITAQDLVYPVIKGFTADTDFPVYTPDNLWDYINGGAESYTALGFVDLHIVEYSKGKKNIIKLEFYRHSDHNMAFGIYAMERAPSYSFFDLGVQAYREEGLVHFTKGEYYVKVSTYSKKKKILQAVGDLAALAEQAIRGSSEYPDIISSMPAEGKMQNEEMYIAENVLGHEFLGNAFRATYKVEDDRFMIYVFPDMGDSYIKRVISNYLKKSDLDTDIDDHGKVAFRDGYNGDVFLAWNTDKIVLINGLKEDKAELANKYINEIISINE